MPTGWPRRSASAPASRAATPPRALQQAHAAQRAPPEALEAAFLLVAEAPQVWALDSASLVLPEHKDAIVITGSHGGLLGGRPETALKYDVRGALYNDAGIGKDEAGVVAPAGARRARHRRRDGLGGERPHRRRALDLRGRHRQPGQRARRGARPRARASAPASSSPGCAAPSPHREEPWPPRCKTARRAR